MPPSFPPKGGNAQRKGGTGEAAAERAETRARTSSEESKDSAARDPEDIRDEEAETTAEKKSSRTRSLIEFVAIVAAALLLSVVIKTFFLQAFYVPSSSMETTLMTGDRIVVNRMATDEEDIHRGDVVVFVDPGGWLDKTEDTRPAWQRWGSRTLQAVGLLPGDAGQHLVKRVIGVGGDTVSCCSADGNLMVNGVEIEETYLDEGMAPSLQEFKVTVPEGELWVMGDNRSNSRDSRAHQSQTGDGFVPVDNVVGRVWAVFYPFSHAGGLEDASDVFAQVPDN
ncbi:signal peptidase I [Actinobaculum sp. 352]|nr:signal peptidase I [Actinobaculum sp. 313]RTE49634.1 signal peptidase I [Actinobaculum sp. 352]